jgi:hypothetical protein
MLQYAIDQATGTNAQLRGRNGRPATRRSNGPEEADGTEAEILRVVFVTGQTLPKRCDLNFGGAYQGAAVMVTTESLRRFADICLAWALKQDDASQKQSIITAALSWKATADAIDRRVKEGRAEVLNDLKAKLN